MKRFTVVGVVGLVCAVCTTAQAAVLDFQLQRQSTQAVSQEWHQHAHDARRTNYSPTPVPTPWRWKWMWGGLRSLPRNVQPITGGGYVFVADGSNGVHVLNKSNGTVVRTLNPGGAINSTPAYDPETGLLYIMSNNGRLYKMNPATGANLGDYNTGAGVNVFAAPCLISGRAFIISGNNVIAVNTADMSMAWSYNAGSPVHTPAAYSSAKNCVVVVTQNLNVHCINNANGQARWSPVKPCSYNYISDTNEALWGWPVIAEQHGLVLVKYRISWDDVLGRSPFPNTNAAIRSRLTSTPAEQCLFAVNLDNGTVPYVCNVGHGGWGDGGYMPMGPMPVVKNFANGDEIAYVIMRGSPCLQDPCDARWDSRFGEMLLDNTTVSGYTGGDVRWMTNTFFPTDEQAYLTMAGDDMFGAHWCFGLAHRISDRSASRGTSSNPIAMTNLPHIMESQRPNQGCTQDNVRHYCSNGLVNCCSDWRATPAGFWIYWNIDAVYDQYWNNYAAWVVSDGLVLYRSNTGAVVALENGNPLAMNDSPWECETQFALYDPDGADAPAPSARTPRCDDGPAVISYTDAGRYDGLEKTVEGTLRYVFNNGKSVLLAFQEPHFGTFKVQIPQTSWRTFGETFGSQIGRNREVLYREGMTIRATGLIQFYQGDPVIYATSPSQIQVVREMVRMLPVEQRYEAGFLDGLWRTLSVR